MQNEQEKQGTVLVVDDIPENIDVLKGALSDEFHVKIATGGEKALALAESALPDLILLDVMMPGMDGFEVCARLKQGEATRDIPVIFVTALTDAVDEERGFMVGGVDYITKPVTPATALARVKTHIALRQARLAIEQWNGNLKGRVMALSSLVVEKGQQLSGVEQERRRNLEEWFEILIWLLDHADPDLSGHGRRVAAMSCAVAERMRLPAQEIENIRLASLLHDIGRVGLPREVTAPKPELLKMPQRERYLSHAVRGQFLLSHIEGMEKVGELIRHHHEQMNGSGTPDRLIGDEIPLGSRIISIADYIDRHTSHSEYGTSLHTILHRVGGLVGRVFDKELVPHFAEVAPDVVAPLVSASGQKVLIPLDRLATGMVMGEDFYSGSQILLAVKHQTVSPEVMQRISRARRLDPPAGKVVSVWR